MKNVLLVFGTRPEAIKMCPLVKELKKHPDEFSVTVCVTGQHREMLQQVLDVFEVEPDYNFDIMRLSQTLSGITISILDKMQKVLDDERPDAVLVHGDTITSFAASLACFFNSVAIGHVEAGLRTYNLRSPWPEEFNRQAVDLIADYYFAPTEKAKKNLLEEGKSEEAIYVTGNTGIDAMKTTVRRDFHHPDLEWAADSRLILLTAHRRENLGDPMRHMFRAIRRVLNEHKDLKVLYPIHLNPEVRAIAEKELEDEERLRLIEPLDVVAFHNFMKASYLILTDSGGIQEEAPYLGKPVLVMRDTTERPEGIEAGTLRLTGTNEDRIYEEFKKLITDQEAYNLMARSVNPYGDGHASQRIVEALRD